MKRSKKLLIMIMVLVLVISVLVLVVVFRYAGSAKVEMISCGGDWSYKVKCPVGTYCKSLNQGPLVGGVCTPIDK